MTALAATRAELFEAVARSIAPRKPLRVSEWAERDRILGSEESPEPGSWSNRRNPLLVEPMDCMSARSPVHEAVCMFPIQFGKTMISSNALGYAMCEHPGPVMVCLPAEVTMNTWVAQKLNPMIENSPAVAAALRSQASRDAANTRTFKEFNGGQLYLQHAGSPARLKSTSVRTLIVDELDEFAANLSSGDDPVDMLDGRTSAFQSTYKRLYISTPGIAGVSRIEAKWKQSDQRRWCWRCPDCNHEQPFEWSGLTYTPDARECWYTCRECGVVINEHQKPALIAAGRWVPANPESKIRGYHANALYYPMGLGPRWIDLVHMWRAAQTDPAKLKTFVNDRLAEPWEDQAMRAVKFNIIAERAEAVPLRPVPRWVLAVTAGIDTQDNRLPVHLLGWGRGMTCWPIDYVELPGDPADEDVWTALVDLLLRPIDREDGAQLRVDASLQDMLGHRTEAVKAFVRSRRGLRRHMAGFGATANNAPALGKGRLQDVNWRGQYDKRGVMAYPVGTVGIKHMLYSWLSADADKPVDARRVRFSDQLDDAYFGGLVSETYNPTRNRFEKKRGGPRNEPLDTWVYAYAAALHPELRLNRWTKAQWDAREAQLLAQIGKAPPVSHGHPAAPIHAPPPGPIALDPRGTPSRPRRRGAVIDPT